jgi:hypothetical protein
MACGSFQRKEAAVVISGILHNEGWIELLTGDHGLYCQVKRFPSLVKVAPFYGDDDR